MPPIFLDGCIAVGIAFLTAFSLGLAQEESYKYLNPAVRYWVVLGLGAVVQGMHALSKFRDGTFQRHTEAAERKEDLESGISKTTITEKTEKKVAITPTPGVDS